jgi:sugar lactone lactonase YvrE
MSITVAPSYRAVIGWEQIPAGYTHPDVAAVAVNSKGRVYLFCRAEHPVLIYERDGRFVGSWGEGIFSMRTHGITIAPDDSVWCTDDAGHSVRKFTPEGKLLLTLGENAGKPSDTGYDGSNLTTVARAGPPFNRPTNLAVAPNGDLYVSDGYGNARVHRFSPSGKLLASWGEPGTGPGQFNLPHSVWVHTDGRVFVCDRENDRIQIFSPSGELLTIWTNVSRPGDLAIDKDGHVFVGEMAWNTDETHLDGRPFAESRSCQMSVRDLEGNLLTRWGEDDPCAPGSFASPHGLCLDSHGDIYVGEVTHTALSRGGRWKPSCHALQKFARV